MARIVGVEIPTSKRGEIGLTSIYGIGKSRARKILESVSIDPNIKVGNWSEEDFSKIREAVTNTYKVEGPLRAEKRLNINRLKHIGCYRGIRHRNGLPVNGQRTKTNARTRKGPKKTVANKKK